MMIYWILCHFTFFWLHFIQLLIYFLNLPLVSEVYSCLNSALNHPCVSSSCFLYTRLPCSLIPTIFFCLVSLFAWLHQFPLFKCYATLIPPTFITLTVIFSPDFRLVYGILLESPSPRSDRHLKDNTCNKTQKTFSLSLHLPFQKLSLVVKGHHYLYNNEKNPNP